MQPLNSGRRVSQILLRATPFFVFGVVGFARFLRTPGVWEAVACLLIAAITFAAWKLGAHAIRGASPERSRLAVAGSLLISPWVFLSVCVGIGTPWQATTEQNLLRYSMLLLGVICLPAGFIMLREELKDTASRLFSSLGLAAVVIGAPLMVASGTFPLTIGVLAKQQEAASGHEPEWIAPLRAQASMVYCIEVAMVYLATAAFAAAMQRSGCLGRGAGRAFTSISLLAALCLAIAVAAGIWFPPQDPKDMFGNPWAIPGFVFGIPAISFIIPCFLGVRALRVAGDDESA